MDLDPAALRARLSSLYSGTMLRMLVSLILLITIIPPAILVTVALQVSNGLLQERFEEQARGMAGQVSADIAERAAYTSRTANLLAGLPSTRVLAERGDERQLVAYMVPMKSRLRVDVLNVTDTSGSIIARAQDSQGRGKLPAPLLQRAQATADKAWALFDEPDGLMIRAITAIRGTAAEPIGMVEVGVILDTTLLQSAFVESGSHLVLVWNGAVKASTISVDDVAVLPTVEQVEAQTGDKLSTIIALNGERYFAVFSIVRTHTDTPGMVGVLIPLAPVDRARNVLLAVLGALLVLLVIVTLLLAYGSARKLTAPLDKLATAAKRIQEGDLRARVAVHSRNEIGILERAFNTMAESLSKREQERERQEAQLAHMATHDSLTGLPNRVVLAEALRTAVAAARRNHAGALLYIDLDQFKMVNDTFSHGCGDRLLVAVAGLLRGALRAEDLVARLGGDEFAALLIDVDPRQAMALAEKLRRIVGDYRFAEDGVHVDVGASIGVAIINGSAPDSEILAQADMACNAAKANGRNRVEFYDTGTPNLAGISGDAHWSSELKDALRENRLHQVYQPVISIDTRRVLYYEALLRLRMGDGTTALPGAFIGAAERVGLIQDVDMWVVRKALDRVKAEKDAGRRLKVAVNLSALTFRSRSIGDDLSRELEARQIEPSTLFIEITETAAIGDLGAPTRAIDTLSSIGCSFALDDFGKGFASFDHLAHLPCELVKIDGSFVLDMNHDISHRAIVRAVNEVAHSLDKQTIAEWVEDADTLNTLRSMGVDYAQGYYVGRPMESLAVRGEAPPLSYAYPPESSGASPRTSNQV